MKIIKRILYFYAGINVLLVFLVMASESVLPEDLHSLLILVVISIIVVFGGLGCLGLAVNNEKLSNLLAIAQAMILFFAIVHIALLIINSLFGTSFSIFKN